MGKGIPIRSISRSLAVLQAVNRGGALSMNDIAEASDIPYPTACRIVQTLLHEGMLERTANKRLYRATAMVQSLSNGFGDSRLASVARAHIVALTEEVVWPMIIASRVGNAMVVRDTTARLTPLSYRDYPVGHTMPLLFSTSGRVCLAFSDPDERAAIFSSLKVTNPSLGDYAESMKFHEDLETIREAGVVAQAFNHAMPSAGRIASLSAPIFENGRSSSALTMVFFASALSVKDAVERYAGPVTRAAANISAELALAA